jgi:hypothetical protein
MGFLRFPTDKTNPFSRTTDIVQSLIVCVLMKKFFLAMGLIALITVTMSSCVSMKRDCQGRKHTRLANGIYL